MNILLDAMGGDNAPDANIKGAVKAINDIEAEVCLVGNKDVINSKIKEFKKEVKNPVVSMSKTLAEPLSFIACCAYARHSNA